MAEPFSGLTVRHTGEQPGALGKETEGRLRHKGSAGVPLALASLPHQSHLVPHFSCLVSKRTFMSPLSLGFWVWGQTM